MLAIACALGTIALAQSESLGEFARQQRAAKRITSPKVITNEDLPTSTVISITGPEAEAIADEDKEKVKGEEKAAAGEEKKKQPAKGASEKGASVDQKEMEAREAAFRKQADDQKKEISNLERELHILQRESELDNPPAWMGRQSPDWAAEAKRTKSAEEIEAKKQALDAAKQKLEEVQEEGRKSGLSASTTESAPATTE